MGVTSDVMRKQENVTIQRYVAVTRSFGNEVELSLSDEIADASRSVESWWERAYCERRFV